MFPELARDLLLDYLGLELLTDNYEPFYLDDVCQLEGYSVNYKLRGIPFYINGDVLDLLRVTSLAYERNRK